MSGLINLYAASVVVFKRGRRGARGRDGISMYLATPVGLASRPGVCAALNGSASIV